MSVQWFYRRCLNTLHRKEYHTKKVLYIYSACVYFRVSEAFDLLVEFISIQWLNDVTDLTAGLWECYTSKTGIWDCSRENMEHRFRCSGTCNKNIKGRMTFKICIHFKRQERTNQCCDALYFKHNIWQKCNGTISQDFRLETWARPI